VGISVEHQEPLRARLLRGTRRLPLSPTQRDVCVLLAEGASQGDLARHLRIEPSTVKDHVSKVYEKVGVNCREDLAALLHQGADPAANDTDGARAGCAPSRCPPGQVPFDPRLTSAAPRQNFPTPTTPRPGGIGACALPVTFPCLTGAAGQGRHPPHRGCGSLGSPAADRHEHAGQCSRLHL
jgi:DNA-binding CsgD family transcriptional regulator